MVNQFEIARTLERDMPPFLSGLAQGLRLSTAERQAIATVDWTLWTPWMVATFGGGENTQAIRSDEPTISRLSKAARVLLGAEVQIETETYLSYAHGEMAQRAQMLGNKQDTVARNRIEKLSTTCANFLVTAGALTGYDQPSWRNQVPTIPQTRIAPTETGSNLHIRFPGTEASAYPLGSSVHSVVTFGPGMSGSMFVGDLIGRADSVHLVSGGFGAAFVNQWNLGQLQVISAGLEMYRQSGQLANALPGQELDHIRMPEVYQYDVGVAAAIGMIASRTVERDKVVDAVVMSAVHSAGAAEVEAGVVGAHQLLADGGLLVVKAPRTSIGDEGGMDIVARQAIPLFGSPVTAGAAGNLNQYFDPLLPTERPADYAIFQK